MVDQVLPITPLGVGQAVSLAYLQHNANINEQAKHNENDMKGFRYLDSNPFTTLHLSRQGEGVMPVVLYKKNVFSRQQHAIDQGLMISSDSNVRTCTLNPTCKNIPLALTILPTLALLHPSWQVG